MKKIDIFSLQTHSGEYATWPLKTQLLMHGAATATYLPGYEILHQFLLDAGEYLLITDWDCPFEEAKEFVLLSATLSILSKRKLGVPYGSFLLMGVQVLDAKNLMLDFGNGNDAKDEWQLTVKPSKNERLDKFFNRRLSLRRDN
jgi:hypothetical protein